MAVFATRIMIYSKGLELVKSEFKTIKESGHNEAIYLEMTYDGFNCFYISVYDRDGEAILTDLGVSTEVFDEIEDEQWERDCVEHGFEYNHWHIERKLNSIDDVYDFIKFLDYISNREWNKNHDK